MNIRKSRYYISYIAYYQTYFVRDVVLDKYLVTIVIRVTMLTTRPTNSCCCSSSMENTWKFLSFCYKKDKSFYLSFHVTLKNIQIIANPFKSFLFFWKFIIFVLLLWLVLVVLLTTTFASFLAVEMTMKNRNGNIIARKEIYLMLLQPTEIM